MEPKEQEKFIHEWLDSALTQYGQAEPHSGLENRILVRLQAEPGRVTARKWQWWPALAAVTAISMIAVGAFLANLNRPGIQAPIARRNPAPVEEKAPVPVLANSIQEAPSRRIRRGVLRPHQQHALESAAARLEQFPSPEPLSKQEEILARYVHQFPHEADLMAQAQTELARQEMIERQTSAGSEISPSSETQNQ